MSRGPGRVERIIEKAFAAKPYHRWSVYPLCLLAFHGAELAPADSEAMLFVPCQSTRVSENERRSVLRAATKVARRRGWQIILDSTWKDTADPDQGKHIGRHVRFVNQSADARAARTQRKRRSARLLKGLPLDPTPEELAAEAAALEASRAARAAQTAAEEKVRSVLGEKLERELNTAQAEIRRLETQLTEAKLQVEIILMKSRSLTNIAAGVIAEHGGDVEAALAAVASRMADDRQDAAE